MAKTSVHTAMEKTIVNHFYIYQEYHTGLEEGPLRLDGIQHAMEVELLITWNQLLIVLMMWLD